MLHFLRKLELLSWGCRVKTEFRLGGGSRGTLSPSMVAGGSCKVETSVETSCTGWVLSSAIWQGWRKGGRRAHPLLYQAGI